MFYSKSTGGFYEREIHDVIPDDAVEITSDYRWELMAGQSTGKVIAADENGYPILQDPPKPTAEQLAAQAKKEQARATAYAKLEKLGLTKADLEAIGI